MDTETVVINGRDYEVEYELVENPADYCMDVEIVAGLPIGLSENERQEIRLEINGRLWEREQERLSA